MLEGGKATLIFLSGPGGGFGFVDRGEVLHTNRNSGQTSEK